MNMQDLVTFAKIWNRLGPVTQAQIESIIFEYENDGIDANTIIFAVEQFKDLPDVKDKLTKWIKDNSA